MCIKLSAAHCNSKMGAFRRRDLLRGGAKFCYKLHVSRYEKNDDAPSFIVLLLGFSFARYSLSVSVEV